MNHKIKVKFIKSVYPYRAWEEWFLKQSQVDNLAKQWLVEVVVSTDNKKTATVKKTPTKKAKNKAIKSEKVSTK